MGFLLTCADARALFLLHLVFAGAIQARVICVRTADLDKLLRRAASPVQPDRSAVPRYALGLGEVGNRLASKINPLQGGMALRFKRLNHASDAGAQIHLGLASIAQRSFPPQTGHGRGYGQRSCGTGPHEHSAACGRTRPPVGCGYGVLPLASGIKPMACCIGRISGFAINMRHTRPVRPFSIITVCGAWFSPIVMPEYQLSC
jgi:hypothetical protein